MDREEVRELTEREVLNINNRAVLIELPTGYGKSKIGMELCLKNNPDTILIIIPRLLLINNWKKEFIKWGQEEALKKVTFSTYAGIHNVSNRCYGCVIIDEAHHITPRVEDYLRTVNSPYFIMLSATVKKNKKEELKAIYSDLYCYKVTTKEAIDNKVLPDPRVFLLPLHLDTTNSIYTIIEHPKAKIIKECLYKDRWQYLRDKNTQVHIKCTEFQYIRELDSKIEFWKKKYMSTRNEGVKAKWLFLAGQRLKFLSQIKNPIILSILKLLKNQRVLTFCSSIEQTELLGKNCINSKNKEASDILDRFNNKKIRHITACNMLNEGMNLVDCRVGLYANLNSSDIIIKQRLGRILRHKDPIIIIPYYIGTREEELVKKMLEDYNPELVKTITNLEEITL